MDCPSYCIICEKSSGEGIIILGKFICSECERTIVNIDINDTDYDIYKDMVKKHIVKEPV